jgi:outer membrane lipoprotein SlyB
MCGTVPTAPAILGILLSQSGYSMKLQTFIVPLLATAALASSCTTTDTRYGSNDTRYAFVHSNENMYAVIDAIETVRRGNDDKAVVGTKREDMYRIRVRFDDGSYRTVAQDSLDGRRVGSSVRIEGDRVRRY